MSATNIDLITTLDYRQIKQSFVEELIIASQGYHSSLSFIRHLLPSKPIITNGIIQAIIIGGTNYDIGTYEVTGKGMIKQLTRKKGPIPNLDSHETFLSFIKEHHDPRAAAIAMNLGFPCKPDIGKYKEIDSAVLYGVKEHAFHGLAGKPIGGLLREYLQVDIPISVANDTVCLALAGSGEENGGFILGSGCNMSIITQEEGRKTVANLESGNFSKFEPTPGLEAIDAVSPTRGKNRFEKLMSGIYLPMHFNFMAKQYGVNAPTVANGKEVSAIAANDQSITGDLARGVLERSSSLAATQFAAVYEFLNAPPHLLFLIEGTLFIDGWEFNNNFQKRLSLLGIPQGRITMKSVSDSSLRGAIGLLTKAS